MTIERRNFPQFFITAPTACPYLPNREERKVFTHLIGQDARALNTHLSQSGFRRSQNIAYRPACDTCQLCVSVRVPVKLFAPSTSQKRVSKSNTDISATLKPAVATGEHYSLFRDYIDTRHNEGGMADMSVLDFANMVDNQIVDNRLVEFRIGHSSIYEGELIGVALIDILGDGISMIYSFFDPSVSHRSLGTFMILDTIARARRMGLPYVYLGYWVKGSKKMDYKSRFMPQERLSIDGWQLHNAT